MPDPLQILRDLYKDYAQRADAQDRQKAQHWDGSYRFPENLPPHMVYMGEDLPPVARAPMYRPQTEVIGEPEFAKGVDKFLTDIPEMRGRSPRIQHGPNDPVFEMLEESGFGPHQMDLTNLNGSMTLDNKHISLNPRLKPGGAGQGFNLEKTLGHELGHTVNVKHGPPMDDLENGIREAYPYTGKDPLSALADAFSTSFKRVK